jgi:arsenite methyltransferase
MACCDPSKTNKTTCCSEAPVLDLREVVRNGYTRIAEQGSLTAVTKGGCCGPGWKADDLASKLGYSTAQLQALPEGTNMGLSCGNPTAIANLRPGQVVLDLGSGGGFDVFLAGPKVGATGRAIGVDMTPAMLGKARTNTAHYRRTTKLDNVEFRLGEIEHLPVADSTVDVVISNCVINLSPDKPQVWREIARVLRPGGTVAVSDMALLRPLPPAMQAKMEALVGCIAGAVPVDDYRAMIQQAGLTDIQLRTKPDYVAALLSMEDPLYKELRALLPQGTTAGDFVTSLDVTARRA